MGHDMADHQVQVPAGFVAPPVKDFHQGGAAVVEAPAPLSDTGLQIRFNTPDPEFVTPADGEVFPPEFIVEISGMGIQAPEINDKRLAIRPVSGLHHGHGAEDIALSSGTVRGADPGVMYFQHNDFLYRDSRTRIECPTGFGFMNLFIKHIALVIKIIING